MTQRLAGSGLAWLPNLMNILIAGAGTIAQRIAEALMDSHQVVSLRQESGETVAFDQLDVETVYGTATSPESLRQARVDQADAFIACTRSDEQNIVACLAAQKLGAGRTVCLLSRSGFLSAPGSGQDLADSLGIDRVIRPAEQLAQEILRIVTVPGALDVRVFAGGQVALLRYRVEPEAAITRAPLKELSLPSEVILVTVRRDDRMIVPRGGTRLEAGDVVVAMGRQRALQRLSGMLRKDKGKRLKQAAIVGAGSVGVGIAEALEAEGWQVKLIESDRRRCEEVAGKLQSLVLHGDGADLELLEQERIGAMPVVVTVTNNDEKNLLVSLLAKSLGVPRIVTRADRVANERMFEKVGVDVVLSTLGAAVRSVVLDVDRSHSDIRAELEHGSAFVMELVLPSSFTSRRLMDLRPPPHTVVGAVTRGRRVLIPSGRDELRPADAVLVFCRTEDKQAVRRFFTSELVASIG